MKSTHKNFSHLVLHLKIKSHNNIAKILIINRFGSLLLINCALNKFIQKKFSLNIIQFEKREILSGGDRKNGMYK